MSKTFACVKLFSIYRSFFYAITNKICITLHDLSSNNKSGMCFPVLAVPEGSIIGCRGNLKPYYFEI